MTYKENITAILECYFSGFKKEIIDSACNRILEIEPCEQDPCDNCKYLDGDGCRLVFEQIEYGKASDECPNDNNVNTKNTVSRETFEQVMWERDIAISQLKELGYGFGEKIEPCGNAIDRKLVCAFIDGLISDDREREKGLEYIRSMPPVNPQEPKTGHWIGHREHCENLGVMPSGLGAYEWCSNCDCGIDVREWHRNNYNYCPNCGAIMIEPQEGSDKE